MLTERFFKRKNVLILGGAGMIGSHLARRLIGLGAKVVLLDSFLKSTGGNIFNIKDIRSTLILRKGSIVDEPLMSRLVKKQHVIFNFSASRNYIKDKNAFIGDFDNTVKGHVLLLECCRRWNRNARIIFASTKLVYGDTKRKEPVSIKEKEPVNPRNFYAVNKRIGEIYSDLYHNAYGLQTMVLRISNVFGPGQHVKDFGHSIIGWLIRLALQNKTIKIFGQGTQTMDYVYIDDVVDAFLRVASHPRRVCGETFNIGRGRGIMFKEIVTTIVSLIGSGKIKHVPWPPHYETKDSWQWVSDISKIQRVTGWRPRVPIKEGLSRTCDFYQKNLSHYT